MLEARNLPYSVQQSLLLSMTDHSAVVTCRFLPSLDEPSDSPAADPAQLSAWPRAQLKASLSRYEPCL